MEHIHLIGIGGSGLSAIALLLHEMGYTVSGSDRADSPFLAELRAAGVTVSLGHRPEQVAGADRVVRSSAVTDDNPEVQAARGAGIPVLKRADLLGQLMAGRIGIAVAGTHGKTTTSAMLAWTLTGLDQSPSFIVGGVLADLGVNAHAGKGPHFVIEADEYDRMFLGLKPQIGVVTNVEHDHPDCYPTVADFEQAFADFAALLPPDGWLVACGDDLGAARLVKGARRMARQVFSYGLDVTCEAVAEGLAANLHGGYDFTARLPQQDAMVSLSVPGEHNVRNALAVLSVIHLMGLPLTEAAVALAHFHGTGRRFEVIGEAAGVTVIDDYAHHPTEIRATLAGARARYPGRTIWAVWQPHTYSRTQTLFDDFAGAFQDADRVIVTEVYRAREAEQDFSASQVVAAMQRPAAQFIPALPEVRAHLLSNLEPGAVLLVLSAGDADQVSREVLAGLQESEEKHD
ncbi:MAG: UDP-N-acetylmuramate--L-alanine ligase [Chloroflexi bacterium]|nr:UDP-N-acetylmuramate--L-alanine ligase [Chloroflexota bacterium]